jgi:hypothetical protein
VQAEVERRIAAGEVVSATEVKQLKRDMATVGHEMMRSTGEITRTSSSEIRGRSQGSW